MDWAVAALGCCPGGQTSPESRRVSLPTALPFTLRKQLTLPAPTPQSPPASGPCIPCLFPGCSSITFPSQDHALHPMYRNLTLIIDKNTSLDCHSPPAVDFSLPFEGNNLCRVTQAPCSSVPVAHALLNPHLGPRPTPPCTVAPARPVTRTPNRHWLPSPYPASGHSGPWGPLFPPPPTMLRLPLSLAPPPAGGPPSPTWTTTGTSPGSLWSQLPPQPLLHPPRRTLCNANLSRPSPAHTASAIKCTWKRATRHWGDPTPTLPAGASQLFPKHEEHAAGARMARVLSLYLGLCRNGRSSQKLTSTPSKPSPLFSSPLSRAHSTA